MKPQKLIVICIVVCLGLSGISSAGMLTLSTMSSDETPAYVLDASILFDVVGTTLTIEVENLTTSPDAYDIPQIFFNADGSKITSLAPTSLPTGWQLVVNDGDEDTKANGFGTFDYLIWTDNQNGIVSGASLSFEFDISGTGPFSQSDFDEEWSCPPPSTKLALVAMKFVKGPCDDSAYGAVPEPATIVMLTLGTLAFIRRKQTR